MFNSLVNCKRHSLWELADYVSFPAVSGTVVASFVVCSYVLFDIKKTWQISLKETVIIVNMISALCGWAEIS